MSYHREIRLSRTQAMTAGLVVAIALLCFEGYSAKRALDARDWVKVAGTITQSKLVRSYSHSTNQHGSSRRRSSKLRLEYKYSYRGKSHTGNRITFGGFEGLVHFSGFDWSGTTEKYPRGKSVDIYIDPENPTASVLDREFPMSGIYAMGVGMTFTILLGGLLLPTRSKPESESSSVIRESVTQSR